MTPAVKLLQKLKVDFQLHEYQHEPSALSYGLEAAEKLAVDPQRVFKTLVIQSESGELWVTIVPVCQQLSLKKAAKAAGCKKMQMANKQLVEKTTGYLVGGVSPFAQKKRLQTLLDLSALSEHSIFVSGGKRGLEIEILATQLSHILNAIECSLVDS